MIRIVETEVAKVSIEHTWKHNQRDCKDGDAVYKNLQGVWKAFKK